MKTKKLRQRMIHQGNIYVQKKFETKDDNIYVQVYMIT